MSRNSEVFFVTVDFIDGAKEKIVDALGVEMEGRMVRIIHDGGAETLYPVRRINSVAVE